MKVNLCKCNNCDNIMIDQNSQVGSKLYDLDKESKCDDFPECIIEEMQYIKDDVGEYFWGCPICETDGYLQDL